MKRIAVVFALLLAGFAAWFGLTPVDVVSAGSSDATVMEAVELPIYSDPFDFAVDPASDMLPAPAQGTYTFKLTSMCGRVSDDPNSGGIVRVRGDKNTETYYEIRPYRGQVVATGIVPAGVDKFVQVPQGTIIADFFTVSGGGKGSYLESRTKAQNKDRCVTTVICTIDGNEQEHPELLDLPIGSLPGNCVAETERPQGQCMFVDWRQDESNPDKYWLKSRHPCYYVKAVRVGDDPQPSEHKAMIHQLSGGGNAYDQDEKGETVHYGYILLSDLNLDPDGEYWLFLVGRSDPYSGTGGTTFMGIKIRNGEVR